MNHLTSGLFLGVIGALFLWIAKQCRFFHVKDVPRVPGDLKYPIIGVIGYLLLFFVIAPSSIHSIGRYLRTFFQGSDILLITLFQMISLVWVTAYLFILSLLQGKTTFRAIWVHPNRSRFSCILEDFALGALTWLIAFPIVGAISQIMEYLTFVLTGVTSVDQIAVRYLIMAKDSPALLSIALFSILVAAPVIEEFVFRGFLYTYLRKKFSMMKAMSISAFIFSIFHFSPDQGMSNIPLISSLFFLALFLGFLYERQRSLLAPIALHMTFNSISVIRIILVST